MPSPTSNLPTPHFHHVPSFPGSSSSRVHMRKDGGESAERNSFVRQSRYREFVSSWFGDQGLEGSIETSSSK